MMMVDDPASCCLGARLSKAEASLQLSHVPKTLVHRERELERLVAFFGSRAESGGSAYVCGLPGTGKSVHVGRACPEATVWLRGTSFATGDAFVRRLAAALDLEGALEEAAPSSQKEALEALGQAARRRRRKRVSCVVIDEMDSLMAVASGAARAAFQLATEPANRIALVAIANAITLPQEHALAPTETIVFEAYTVDQLKAIVHHRLPTKGLFDDKAVQWAAQIAAGRFGGDARRVLDLCAAAIRFARADHRENKTTSNNNDDDDDRVVLLKHVQAAIKSAAPDTLATSVAGLPLHAKLALKAALALHASSAADKENGRFTKLDLNRAYAKACPGSMNQGDCAFDEAVSVLESTGFIKRAGGPALPSTTAAAIASSHSTTPGSRRAASLFQSRPPASRKKRKLPGGHRHLGGGPAAAAHGSRGAAAIALVLDVNPDKLAHALNPPQRPAAAPRRPS